MLLNPDMSMQLDEPVAAKRRPRWPRRVALGTGLLVLVMAFLAAAVAWQATRSSVNLDILRGRIEAAIRARLPADADVAIGSAAFSYNADQGFVVKARDVRLALAGAAEFDAAEIATTATPSAILSGRLDLRSIIVSGIDIGIAIRPAPEGAGSRADIIRHAAASLAAELAKTDALLRGAGLQEVTVRNARLYVVDKAAGMGPALRVSEANWQPSGVGRSKAWLKVAGDGGGAWDLTVERQSASGGGAVVTMAVEALPISALAPELAKDDGGPFLQSALTFQADLSTGADGAISEMRGIVSTGRGLFSFTGKESIKLAGAEVSLTLGPQGDRLEIPHAEVRTPMGEVEFEGAIDLGDAARMTLSGQVQRGALPTGAGRPPIALTGGGALVRYDLAKSRLDIERFDLATAGGTVSAVGEVGLAGDAPGLSLALSFTEMSTAALRAFWPPFVAAKTRAWFDTNVKSGFIGPATLQIALPSEFLGPSGRDKILPNDALVGSLPFRDATFLPLKSFPAIENAAGEIGFANATATIRTWAGFLTIPGEGDLQAGGTELTIPGLGPSELHGELRLVISGPASALAELSNTPPLSVAKNRGIAPEAVSGDAQLSLDANIPLKSGGITGVSPDFRLTLADFSSTSPIDGRLIGDADLVLEGSPKSFTVKGEGVLDGLQASIDLVQGSAAEDQTDVSLTLDDAARERLGFGFADVVTGPIQVSMTGNEADGQVIDLDLKDTRISLPMLGWEKGSGVPANAHFTMRKGDRGIAITDLLLSGKGFGAKGSLAVGPDGKLRDLSLDEVALRPGDNLSATVVPDGAGYEVRLRGRALDARGILRGVKAGLGGGKSGAGTIRISLDVQEVIGQGDVVLSDVSGSIALTGKGLDRVSIKGKASASGPFEWTLGKEGDSRVLRLYADDGGALFRFAGIYNKVVGGNLILDYSGQAGGAGSGVLVIRDFKLRDEAALSPAVETARRAAKDRADSASGSNDLSFSQLKVPFRQDGWVLSIDDAALRGALIGATASGTVNIPGGKIAISGTFIPAFGLNNIAGAIPIIGTILGGGRDEGLLGITYKLFGPLDEPKLTMNPVSAIAPGIFRKIFEYR